MTHTDFLVVGGGIVGLATALRLQHSHPDSTVRILEKEPVVGAHQSTHNSGVLHCGLYYKPGSAKARLAVSGIRQMVEFCQQHGIAHEICGKIVVATAEEEIPRLKALLERGTANGLAGLRWLSRDEMREIEPHVGGLAALRVPQEGIVDYAQVCRTMATLIQEQGGFIETGAGARRLDQIPDGWRATTPRGAFEGSLLVNCAGLHCDRVSQLAGNERRTRILPFRGEYYKLNPESQHLVRHLIYPVPDPRFPFLGVHFTRLIHGGIEAGPNAVLAFAREGYKKTDINLADLWDSLTYPGLWRFLARYPDTAWGEVRRSFSKRLFCHSLQRLVPEIEPDHLGRGGAGVRAQAIGREGELVQDFEFVTGRRSLHVLCAPSPAATASLAIGEEIVRYLEEHVALDRPVQVAPGGPA